MGLGLSDLNLTLTALALVPLLLVLVLVVVLATRFRRCPPNKLLVVYGRGVPGGMKVMQSGAALVWPLMQDSALLSLEPLQVSLTMDRLLSRSNEQVDVKATVVIAIGTDPERTRNAAERLLGYTEDKIEELARDILSSNLRMVVATLEVPQMKSDQEAFSSKAIQEAEPELKKVGLDIISYKFERVYQKP
jgi:flotillin